MFSKEKRAVSDIAKGDTILSKLKDFFNRLIGNHYTYNDYILDRMEADYWESVHKDQNRIDIYLHISENDN